MAKKIQGPMPSNAFVSGIDQKFAPGTIVCVPKNCFGMVVYKSEVLKLFDDKVKLDAKSVPGLKMPKIPFFGKIEGVSIYFFPYGLKGSYYLDTIIQANGKKMAIKMRVAYNLTVEKPSIVKKLLDKTHRYCMDTNGALVEPSDIKFLLNDKIYEYLRAREKAGKTWKYIPTGTRLESAENTETEICLRVEIEKVFEEVGYKCSALNTKVDLIDYVEE